MVDNSTTQGRRLQGHDSFVIYNNIGWISTDSNGHDNTAALRSL